MLFELLILASCGIPVAIVGLLLVEVIKAQLCWLRFKRDTKGLPISDGRSIFGNHLFRWGLCKNTLHEIKGFQEALGGPKTVGWLFGNQYAACTTDLELMKRIVLEEPNKNINRVAIKAPLSEYMDDNIMLAFDDQWRRLRRAVAPALRANRFKAPNVLNEIDGSINKMIAAIESKLELAAADKQNEIRLEIDELINRYSLDLVFGCFYKQYDQIDYTAKDCHWTSQLEEALASTLTNPLIKLGLILSPIRIVLDWAIWNFHKQGEWRQKISHFIRMQLNQSLKARKHLNESRARGAQVDNEDNFLLADGSRFRRNMADYIADHLFEGKITEREFINTSSFLVMAADKTAADALVYTLYQLAINSQIQERVRQAVRNEGAEAEYLAWVVNESLRLMPPAPVSCSRTIAEDMLIEGGHRLPEGTFVVFPGYLVHRLKEYWGEDAEEFKPERWQDTSNHHPLQYVPFGAGVRQCPGREFALFEIKELLSRLLLRYEFSSKPKPDANQFDSPFLIYLLFHSPTFIKVRRIAQEINGEQLCSVDESLENTNATRRRASGQKVAPDQ